MPAAEERLDRGDRDGGVLGLVAPEQRQREVAVLAREARDRDELAADGDPRVEHREGVALDGERAASVSSAVARAPRAPRADCIAVTTAARA